MPNGNGKWIVKWLVGALWGALVLVVMFIGNTVRANDDKATTEHTAIREEVQNKDNDLRKELMTKIEAVQTEQKAMRKETSKGFTDVLVAIAELKK